MNPRQVIRKVLDTAGMDYVDHPHDLFQHVANECAAHDDFRKLLGGMPPEQRKRAYDTIAPRLRFVAHQLSRYMAENADEAERRQLPTIEADGTLKGFERPEIESEGYRLGRAIMDEIGKHKLVLKCRKCTREATFGANRKSDAVQAARNEGWTYNEIDGTGYEICPQCPGGKLN